MIQILLIALIAAWGLAMSKKLMRSVHMLQLNSYRNERYMRWINRNTRKAFQVRDYLLAIPAALVLLGFETVGLVLLVVGFAALFFMSKEEQQKKKLVLTPRVKRMLTTAAIVLAIFAAASGVVGIVAEQPALAAILLLIVYVLGFFVIIVANTVNRPIEKSINNKYFNEAESMIQESRDLNVVGITGSYGKTSTKHFLQAILSSELNVLMTPESYNTKLGVTKTVRGYLKPYHDVFIAEMGAKQKGDIQEICDLVHQRIGILTSIGPQHLETFKTIETVQKTKYEIIESLPEDGLGILNKDDENIMSYTPKNQCRKVYYGIHSDDVDFKAKDITYTSSGMTFTVEEKGGGSETYTTKLLGEHNIYNTLAGIAVGRELGLSLEKMKTPIKNMPPVKHRLELKKPQGNITILDDSFNSNPKGARMAVDVLGQMDEYKVLITPGMIELGEKEYELNKELAMHAAGKCDFIILVGERQTKPLQDGLKEAGYPEAQTYVARDLNDGLAKMHELATRKMVVLLENDLPDNYNG
ncbi:UDP-N-acetylmuramoyl-tripeptide--D-alanyl-D-alanine ligase [Alteribacter natronophilus]|uniref:UDP-N-acetylmuramoyl-tripeptide--D-alanyl-D- alanine ligase n=1 Tax=Alteribacter natronophilus TaxID=2583810 RepID=UPI00110EAD68|nr:UDP-N-acetylmuramoyl-tripeptide--D-alanyl-D-alanine ligase [Alteribacter natronophilus]TMW70747.1 UDP-N-acetylmuramoyl-tripeptide--D-alanyl-D-alanine ligase [Alteribacter natronophilus]